MDVRSTHLSALGLALARRNNRLDISRLLPPLRFIPAPDGMGEDVYSAQGSIVGYIDRILLPGNIIYGNIDP